MRNETRRWWTPGAALGMALEKPLTYSDVFRSVSGMAAMLMSFQRFQEQ